MRTLASVIFGLTLAVPVTAGEVSFSAKPSASKDGDKVKIAFTVSAPTDVEVAVLAADGKVVRHLAAGALGAPKPPPEPLKAGLSQSIEWDGQDDFGKAAAGGPWKVRVRAGMGVKFGRLIGADPYNFGKVVSSAADEDGNLYLLGFAGQLNQGHMCLRVFDKEGKYLREIVPFPADLPKDALKGVARWDEEAKSWRPNNRRNLNPDFYGQPGSSNVGHSSMTLVSASKQGGVVLAGKDRTVVLEANGAVRGVEGKGGGAPRQPDPATLETLKARLTFKGDDKSSLPTDWNRLAMDFERDEVYVSDGARCLWRFDGETGAGTLLKKDHKPFWAADLAVGRDGLLYVRKCMGYTPGVTDFSGPLERYTRELAPAPYAGGSHVLSKNIYGRYGVGYADRGIGVGPDGKVYITFMYEWVKYCMAGFGPDGKPLKGKCLDGKVGNRGDPKRNYPEDLTSAVIGPITGANGGVRVDLKGNLYLGLWVWPKPPAIRRGFEQDQGYKYSVGSVVRFAPEGGFMAVKGGWLGADPIEVVPRTAGAAGQEAVNSIFGELFIEGATAIYQGLGPFSHSPYAGNTCCVCRAPRFDLDPYGRLAMPNAITNSVQLLDNAGNLVLEFGKYGNFDSQYVPPDSKDKKPLVAGPEIPLAWPTGAGFSQGRVYVLDTYCRRIVRVDQTFAAEETCEVK